MSNANYEFLLYDRPVILLADEWLRSNFSDIGTKATLASRFGGESSAIGWHGGWYLTLHQSEDDHSQCD